MIKLLSWLSRSVVVVAEVAVWVTPAVAEVLVVVNMPVSMITVIIMHKKGEWRTKPIRAG